MGSWRTDPAEGFVVIGGYPTATLTWRTPHTLKQGLKYSEDQPRDEQGRFTETGGGDTIAQLQASLPTTTEPRRTHFLLPDGTRLTNPPEHGAHSAHAVLAHRAGVTLDEVVAAGGVRYLSIAGVEVGAPLTTRQADILIDDWFGYNTSLSIDVAVGGSIVASREFDIPNGEVSAGTLQSWVQARLDAHAADRRKWSEEQHPRVPAGDPGGGQFTSTDGGVTGAGGESSRVSFPTVHSVDEAIAKIGDGEGVMFTQPMEAVVMVEKLARELEHAEGEKKVYNLCQVQVRDTNFFCSAESKIPRSEMPQLSGQAIPGTPADHLPRNRWGEVDVSEQFRQHLRSQGVDVIQQAVLVSRMRPTQNEMDTYKIAQIVKVVKTYEREGLPTTPMWMSRDNYIIDGHHRWAATALLSIKGKADRIEAYVVNLPVFKLLKEARTFSKQIGIRQLAVGKSVACAVCLAIKYSEDQPRDEQGRWTDGGGGFEPTDPATFVAARDVSTRSVYLSHYSAQELTDKQLYLSADGKTGYLLDEHGDLQNVFNNGGQRGAGKQAVLDAVRNGATTLDCFDGFLPEFYAKAGFVVTGRMPFNDDYKPVGWDVNTLGRPDVIFMSYQGGDRATIAERYNTFKPYLGTEGRRYTDWDAAKTDSRRAVRDGATHSQPRPSLRTRQLGQSDRATSLPRHIVSTEPSSQKAMNADREDLPALIARADRLEPLMRRKFLQAIKEAKAAINLSDLAQAVRTGNMVRVTESLKLAELEGRLKVGTTETLRLGYMAGARVGADRLESVNIRVRFDLMSPHAVQWAEKHAGRLITEITANQRLGVQQLMADAQRLGRTVDETARDLKTFIGLHSRQQDAIEKLRTRLETRDLPEAAIDKKVGRYAEGLLNQRARTIARTEMVQAAHYGQREQWDQASAQGLFDKTTTRREWITTVDDLTDVPICLEMDGQTVGYDELWELPDGHGSVRVPGESHPNCRCAEELLFDQ